MPAMTRKKDHHWVLKGIDLYESIPEKEFCAIAVSAVDKNYAKDAVVYTPHEPVGHIYVVHSGEVILYHSKEGRRAIFDTLGPGSVFGCFDPENPTPAHFAQAIKPTVLCTTPVSEFMQIVAKHPELMLRLMQKMAIRISDYEQKIGAGMNTAVERVYQELLRLRKKKQNSSLGRPLPIPLQATHEQLAERTNLNRVTVTRCLRQLRERGLIAVDKNTGIIRLPER